RSPYQCCWVLASPFGLLLRGLRHLLRSWRRGHQNRRLSRRQTLCCTHLKRIFAIKLGGFCPATYKPVRRRLPQAPSALPSPHLPTERSQTCAYYPIHRISRSRRYLTWSSPKGKFIGAGKEISEALGRKPESTDLNERHPFDVEILR